MIEEEAGMQHEASRITRVRNQPLATAPLWLLLLALWAVLEIGWRWRRVRALIS